MASIRRLCLCFPLGGAGLRPLLFIGGFAIERNCSSSASSLTLPVPETHDPEEQFLNHVMTKCRTDGGFKNFDDAYSCFERMFLMRPLPSIIDFNRLLGVIVRMKCYSAAVTLIENLYLSGMSPDLATCSILMNCLCHLKCVDFAFTVLARVFKLGFEPDLITMNSLVNGLCMDGKTSSAVNLVDEMGKHKGLTPDAVTCGTLIKGVVSSGKADVDLAIGLLEKLEGRGLLDVVTYSTVINSLCLNGEIVKALEVFQSMMRNGIPPDIVTYNILIDGFCHIGNIEAAIELFNEIEAIGQNPNLRTYSVLLGGLCKFGRMDIATRLINHMKARGVSPDMYIFNILINGMCISQELDSAKALFHSLKNRGFDPDTMTFTTLIKGLCKEDRIKEALFCEMKERGCHSSVVYNILARWFLKHNETVKAMKVLREMGYCGYSMDAYTNELLLHIGKKKFYGHSIVRVA